MLYVQLNSLFILYIQSTSNYEFQTYLPSYKANCIDELKDNNIFKNSVL